MCRIKIKNFGPISTGFEENGGWMEISKVTILIGDQGVGKSTIAKLVSIFLWLEKSVVRGSIQIEQLNMNIFKTLCLQQEISEYFGNGAQLSFEGDVCRFYCDEEKNLFSGSCDWERLSEYVLPQIQYMSAARNLLTILYNISLQSVVDKEGNFLDLSSNIPFMVKDLSKVYLKALAEIAKDGFLLPINETSVFFQNHNAFIRTRGKDISIAASSSGVQSVTPLSLVSCYLSREVQKDMFEKIQTIDNNLKLYIEKELSAEDEELTAEFRQLYSFGSGILIKNSKKLRSKLKRFIPSCFINIVEEPEQNLYPTSQHKIINQLLGINNSVNENRLIITTHSPYILNYVMLAIKAASIVERLGDNKEAKIKVFDIVPQDAITPLQNVIIYAIDDNGSVKKLEEVLGLPTNENYLNDELGKNNTMFSELLEIEELCVE